MRYALAAHSCDPSHDRMVFDTDSIPILIDSGASYCMTNDRRDFIDDPIPITTNIQGLGDSQATMRGTIRYSLSDDSGCVTSFIIKDCYLVPTLPIRIFSPQHWFDTHSDRGVRHYLKRVNGRTHAVLEWDGTVRHVSKNAANVFVMHSPPGFSTSNKVLTGLSALLPDVPSCFPAHVIPPDEDDDALSPSDSVTPEPSHVLRITNSSTLSSLDRPMWSNHPQSCEPEHEEDTQSPATFDLDNVIPIVENGEPAELDQVSSHNPTASLLHWHYRLGHLSFKVLQQMAQRGAIDKALATCAIPQCSACLYGKATKRAWRTKATPSHVSPVTISAPGDCISVDQLESSVPGLIAQLRSFLTRQCFTCTTVFDDHFSHLSYV